MSDFLIVFINLKNSNDKIKELIVDFKSKKNSFNEDFAIRIHRSLSWLKRSEVEIEDMDAKFIFLWISFNSIYSGLEGFDEKSYVQNVLVNILRCLF